MASLLPVAQTLPVAPVDLEAMRLNKLKEVCVKYDINFDSVGALRQLEDFQIVLLCDDSGSMGTAIKVPGADPFAKKMTRWDELSLTSTIITDVAGALDKDGIDIYFLNRPAMLNVKNVSQLLPAFATKPKGYTPTVKAMEYIAAAKAEDLAESKVLLILCTDGEPTDDHGTPMIPGFIECIKRKHPNLYLSIVACTDDEKSVGYLDALMEQGVENLDVSDDYRTEKDEVLEAKGADFKFSYGDYICKVLLGPVNSEFGDKALGLIGDKSGKF